VSYLSSFHHCVVFSGFANSNSSADASFVFDVGYGLVHNYTLRPTVMNTGSMTGRQRLFSSTGISVAWAMMVEMESVAHE
jgi:hypothetical protein